MHDDDSGAEAGGAAVVFPPATLGLGSRLRGLRDRLLVGSLIFNFLALAGAAAWLVRRHLHPFTGDNTAARARADLFRELGRQPVRGQVVLLGDSLTQWGEWPELLGRPALNRGIAGERIEDIRARARDLAELQPSVVVLTAGTNDLAAGESPQHVADERAALVRELQTMLPGARLLVVDVPPVRELGLRPEHRRLSARLIEETNRAGRAVLPARVEAVDLHELAEDGQLRERYQVDGVHLSGAGYRAWAAILRARLN